jgi:hypothetical protein
VLAACVVVGASVVVVVGAWVVVVVVVGAWVVVVVVVGAWVVVVVVVGATALASYISYFVFHDGFEMVLSDAHIPHKFDCTPPMLSPSATPNPKRKLTLVVHVFVQAACELAMIALLNES